MKYSLKSLIKMAPLTVEQAQFHFVESKTGDSFFYRQCRNVLVSHVGLSPHYRPPYVSREGIDPQEYGKIFSNVTISKPKLQQN